MTVIVIVTFINKQLSFSRGLIKEKHICQSLGRVGHQSDISTNLRCLFLIDVGSSLIDWEVAFAKASAVPQ